MRLYAKLFQRRLFSGSDCFYRVAIIKLNFNGSYLDLISNSFSVVYFIIGKVALFLYTILLAFIFDLFRYGIISIIVLLTRSWGRSPILSGSCSLLVISIEDRNEKFCTFCAFCRVIVNCWACTIVGRRTLVWGRTTLHLTFTRNDPFCESLGTCYATIWTR